MLLARTREKRRRKYQPEECLVGLQHSDRLHGYVNHKTENLVIARPWQCGDVAQRFKSTNNIGSAGMVHCVWN